MICELLLENGTNPLTETRIGVSPLYTASKNGHKDVVRILLKFGADVTRVCAEVCAYTYHICVLYIIIHDPFIYVTIYMDFSNLIVCQTFFAQIFSKLLKYDLYEGYIVVTKFINKSHTHNQYWWPPQCVIASYSTVLVDTLKRFR